ncbi:MAG: BamA/TamA family outer membrane protein [Bacteroidia bacterium]|nr:BamA/TamA family outer membrane protein [Bacteroidia bacterium]
MNAIYNVDWQQEPLSDREKFRRYDRILSSGLVLNQIYDNRDNLFSTSQGTYFEFRQSFYHDKLGSDFNFRVMELDYRKFFKPFARRADVVALNAYAYCSSDNTPFTEMALLGSSSIMRGYYQGRYRDYHLLAFQAEYRAHLVGRLGLVGFAGLGNVDNHLGVFNWGTLKHSVGGGLRFTVMKEENLKLRFDYAFGQNSSNFYFGVAELLRKNQTTLNSANSIAISSSLALKGSKIKLTGWVCMARLRVYSSF